MRAINQDQSMFEANPPNNQRVVLNNIENNIEWYDLVLLVTLQLSRVFSPDDGI
jgi:hypothetical protein